MATQDERVEVVRVCDVKGGGGGGSEEEMAEKKPTTDDHSQSKSPLSLSLVFRDGCVCVCSVFLAKRLSLSSLSQLLSLTYTSPVGVAYSGSAPQYWREISLQQYHRKVPTHMHGPSPGNRDNHTPSDHTRVWQYLPPPSVRNGTKTNKYTHSLSLSHSHLHTLSHTLQIRLHI